jgi:ATP-binding cassette subfamily B protein RaxB
MGLQAPTSGQVIFNGAEIHKTPIEDYRDNVAAVIQNDDVFSGTILENISGFSPNPNLNAVNNSLARACILDEINSLPLGIMTKITPNMPILSAGQKQRIMLARALYRQKKLLFLDEATCNLDLDLEKRVLENIMNLPISIISVSHRRSFYTKMTKIIIFQKDGSWKLVSKK